MIFIFDSASNTITSKDITDTTKNDNQTANFDSIVTASGSSYLAGSPEKHVIGEIHTHPRLHMELSPHGGVTTFGGNHKENSSGLSDIDLQRLQGFGVAPAYVFGVYENSENPVIWTIDKTASSHGESYNPNNARFQDVLNGNFNLIMHSLLRNKVGL
jgi:hypothetical protein